MKTQHTPGPWKATKFGSIEYKYGILGEAYDFNPGFEAMEGEKLPHMANARLIAAAPEMLDLLSECLEQLEALHYLYEGEFSERIEAADKAAVRAWKLIAKLTAE